MIMGVVASRRARGDRIELWVGGKAKKEPTPGDWIDRLKEVLADQLEMPEVSFYNLPLLPLISVEVSVLFFGQLTIRALQLTATDEQVQEAFLDGVLLL
jgi:hypothetical protein